MPNFTQKYRATYIAIPIALTLWLVTLFTHLDFFEHFAGYLMEMERYEIDELAIGLSLVVFAVTLDLILLKKHKNHELEISQQRLHIMKATMYTVHDIVGNAFNEIQFFQMQAEESGALSPESIQELRYLLTETSEKLQAISDLEHTPEKTFSSGLTVIDINAPLPMKETKKAG